MSQRSSGSDAGASEVADRLHSGAIRLLRRLRRADAEAGLSGPQSSALSVLVFGGPLNLKALAAAEQVRAPTMSRLVSEMEASRLVTRRRSADDRRAVVVEATPYGRALLQKARERRLETLAASLAGLSAADRGLLGRAAALLERLGREG